MCACVKDERKLGKVFFSGDVQLMLYELRVDPRLVSRQAPPPCDSPGCRQTAAGSKKASLPFSLSAVPLGKTHINTAVKLTAHIGCNPSNSPQQLTQSLTPFYFSHICFNFGLDQLYTCPPRISCQIYIYPFPILNYEHQCCHMKFCDPCVFILHTSCVCVRVCLN